MLDWTSNRKYGGFGYLKEKNVIYVEKVACYD